MSASGFCPATGESSLLFNGPSSTDDLADGVETLDTPGSSSMSDMVML